MTLRYTLFVLLTLLLLVLIAASAWRTALFLRRWQPDRNLLLSPPELVVRVILVLFCILLGWLSGLPTAVLGWQAPDWQGDLAWGVAVGVGLAVVLNPLTRWAMRVWGAHIYSTVVMRNLLPKSLGQAAALTLAFIPAVLLEELLFRSLLLGGVAAPLLPVGRWLVAVLLAVLFGLMHLPQGRWGTFVTGAAGLAFSVLFLTRASLLAPLLAHYLANILQLYQAYALHHSPQPPLTPGTSPPA